MSDKLTQNEIQELEQTLDNNKRNDNSALKDLLDKLPPGLIGGDKKQRLDEIQDNNAAAQVEQMNVSPREPEELTQQVQQVFRQIMPVIEFHDEIFQNISQALEKIPILPKILEQFQEQMSMVCCHTILPESLVAGIAPATWLLTQAANYSLTLTVGVHSNRSICSTNYPADQERAHDGLFGDYREQQERAAHRVRGRRLDRPHAFVSVLLGVVSRTRIRLFGI